MTLLLASLACVLPYDKGAPDTGDSASGDTAAPALDCTEEEVPSVELHVSSAAGGPVATAEAFYVPSDEDWTEPGVCDVGLDGLSDDAIFFCGGERAGDLDVWVTAPGHQHWSETITVAHDGCHPVTEIRYVELVPN